jgi:hypothetical protein
VRYGFGRYLAVTGNQKKTAQIVGAKAKTICAVTGLVDRYFEEILWFGHRLL